MKTVKFPSEDTIVEVIVATPVFPGASEQIIDAIASIVANRAETEVTAQELVQALADDTHAFNLPIRTALLAYFPGWIDKLFGDSDVTREAKRLLKEGK